MAERGLLGVDVGTSSCKVLLLSPAGAVIASTSVPYTPLYPRTGWAEQDPQEWFEAAAQGIQRLLAKSECRGWEPAALGLTGQMVSAVFVDHRGEPLCPSILWLDQRSAPQAAHIAAVGAEEVSQKTKTPINTAYTLPRLLWLRVERPELHKRLNKILLPKDYVRFKMTGEYFTDYSDASSTLMLDSQQRQWSSEILQLLDVEPSVLPTLRSSHDVVGHVSAWAARRTGLGRGLPVIAGAGDLFSENLAAGNIDSKSRLVRFGSCGSISSPLNRPVLDPHARCPCYVHCIPDRWLMETSSQAFGLADAWFRQAFCAQATVGEPTFHYLYKQTDEEIAEVPPGANGLVFRPFIQGAPYWEPSIRGAFIGVTLTHQRPQFARAVLEGATYALIDALQLLNQATQAPTDPAELQWKAVGGGAQSPVWTQMVADMLGADILVLGNADPAKGAAMLAGVGSGTFTSFEYALRVCTPSGEQVRYDQQRHKLYRALYDKYKLAHARLRALDQEIDCRYPENPQELADASAGDC